MWKQKKLWQSSSDVSVTSNSSNNNNNIASFENVSKLFAFEVAQQALIGLVPLAVPSQHPSSRIYPISIPAAFDLTLVQKVEPKVHRIACCLHA